MEEQASCWWLMFSRHGSSSRNTQLLPPPPLEGVSTTGQVMADYDLQTHSNLRLSDVWKNRAVQNHRNRARRGARTCNLPIDIRSHDPTRSPSAFGAWWAFLGGRNSFRSCLGLRGLGRTLRRKTRRSDPGSRLAPITVQTEPGMDALPAGSLRTGSTRSCRYEQDRLDTKSRP